MSKWIVTQESWIVNTGEIVAIAPPKYDYSSVYEITAFMGMRDREYIVLGGYKIEDGKEVLQQVISFLNDPTEAVFIMPEAKGN